MVNVYSRICRVGYAGSEGIVEIVWNASGRLVLRYFGASIIVDCRAAR